MKTLEQLRILCNEWVYDNNYMKQHSAFKGIEPAMIAKQQQSFNNTTKLIEEISLN